MNIRKVLSLYALGTIPVSWASAQNFQGHVNSVNSGNAWSYSITNDESPFSLLKGGVLYVTLGAPNNIGTAQWITTPVAPPGWSYDTDYRTWVAWFVTDTAPVSALVDPGETQGGFSITCTPPSGAVPVSALQPTYFQGADPATTTEGLYGGGMVLAPTNAPGGVVSGTIGFDSLAGSSQEPIPVTFEFRLQGTLTLASVQIALVMPSGEFAVPGPNTPGTYDISIKPLTMLRRTVTIDTTSTVSGLSLMLVNGDCNGDNVIDLSDYTVLIVAFNALPTSGNWDPTADLNGDGVIDLTDYTIVVTNFNAIGD